MSLWAEPEDYEIRFHTNTSFFLLLPSQRPSGNVFTQIAKITVTVSVSRRRGVSQNTKFLAQFSDGKGGIYSNE